MVISKIAVTFGRSLKKESGIGSRRHYDNSTLSTRKITLESRFSHKIQTYLFYEKMASSTILSIHLIVNSVQITNTNIMKTLLIILGLTIATNSFAQRINLDSLILSKKPKYLEGVVPVYVIPGYETKAILWQSTITEAKKFFENKYPRTSIKAKLAVLDSTNWTNEVYAYGYTYGSKGWIVLPGDEDFSDYLRIFGAAPFRKELINAYNENGLDPNELPVISFQFVAVHELGHLIVQQLIKEGIPGEYLNEVVANILAWEFFKTHKPEVMNSIELFFDVFRKNYTNPKYTTLRELSENYGKMDMPNYVWYHINMLRLVEEIYAVKDVDLLSCIMEIRQEREIQNLDNITMGSLLDKYYNGIFSRWLAKYN